MVSGMHTLSLRTGEVPETILPVLPLELECVSEVLLSTPNEPTLQKIGSKTKTPKLSLERCPLAGSARVVLPEVTFDRDDILCIGWNPGAEEVKARRPFVGPSGKLLRGWLKRVDVLDRTAFTNTCMYRPPDGNRKPTKEEIAGCQPLLLRLIERLQPKLIICLGDVPARMFGFKGSVGQMVGRFKIEGPSLLVTLYHPAYSVRLKGSKRFAEVEAQTLEILQEALYRISGEREVEQYPHTILDSIYLVDHKPTALDTESEGERDSRLTTLTSVQTYNGTGTVLIGKSIVCGPKHPLVFHNAIHDLIVLARYSSCQERVIGDSMVAAWMLGRQNLSLKGLSWRELGASVIDYEEAHALGGKVWDNYAAQDPVLTWRLHEKLYPELKHKGISWLYDNVEMPLQPILADMSLQGLMIDHNKLMEHWSIMDSRMEVLESRLKVIAPDINPNSPSQVLQYIKSIGYPSLKGTGVLELRALPNPPDYIQLLLSYRKAQKRISTYDIPLSQANYISGMFNPCGAQTGRLSQSKKNIQNFPADIKSCVVARPGYTFVYRDYSQIELRLAAATSKDEYLLGALREGRNLHEELCIAVFGYRAPEQYTKSKSANFERLYGGSLKTRSNALGVSESRLSRVEPPWPGFEAWAASTRQRAQVTGEARTHMGRMMPLTGIESADAYLRDKAEREAINMPYQGGASDICKYAMVLAHPHIKQLGGRVAHQEHDSILCEVPTDRTVLADEALEEAMTKAIPDDIKEIIDIPSKSVISSHWG